MKKRFLIQCLVKDGTLKDSRDYEFSNEKDRDAALELIALACGIDGRMAFTGYGQCSSNGYIFKRITMLED